MQDSELIFVNARQAEGCETVAMIRSLHLTIVLLAALALALAGGLRPVGAVHAAGLTALVICSDHGTKTVYLDAKGQPVTPASCEQCPDCLGNGAVPVTTATPLTRQVLARLAPALRRGRQVSRSQTRLRPEARGPPAATKGWSDPCLADVTASLGQVPQARLTLLNGKAARLCHRLGSTTKEVRP